LECKSIICVVKEYTERIRRGIEKEKEKLQLQKRRLRRRRPRKR